VIVARSPGGSKPFLPQQEMPVTLEPEAQRSSGATPAVKFQEQADAARVPAAQSRPTRIRERFVVLATPRTGSSSLVELLNAHPQLTCMGELFNPKGTVLRELGMRNKKVLTEAGQTPLEFLNRIMSQHESDEKCKPYFGFKMMLHHDPRMIDYVIDDDRWTPVVLERRNLMGQWTSMALAKKTGRWDVGAKGKSNNRMPHVTGDEDDDDDDDYDDDSDSESGEAVRKVTFDAWKFEQYSFRMRARYASIYHRLRHRRYFRLITEEMDSCHAKLLEFLGVDPTVALPQPRPRQNATSMRDRIANFDAFEKYAKKHAADAGG
jgi:hypothetical protein